MKEKLKTMRRVLALVLVFVLGLSFATPVASSAKGKTATVTMKAKKVTSYGYNPATDDLLGESAKVYFNGNGDIPYLDLCKEKAGLDQLFAMAGSTTGLKEKKKGNTVTWTRTYQGVPFDCVFDFKKNTINFVDLDGFFRFENNSLLSSESVLPTVASLFQQGRTYNRFGKSIKIDLNKYGIKLLKTKKGYYIPLQTFSDIFMSPFGMFYLYNGDALFMYNNSSIPEKMEEAYYKAPVKKNSKAFAAFNYNELCLALDMNYGLKETHDIGTFDDFFTETGLKSLIMDQDAGMTDVALNTVINLYFDDLHCAAGSLTYNTDRDKIQKVIESIPEGSFREKTIATMKELNGARKVYYPNGFVPYEEVGDTAYITFDSFAGGVVGGDLTIPGDADLPNLGNDTFKLMQYSLAKITRPGSPIKRVVLDLSCNGGGQANTACYVLGTFLGESSMSFKNMLTHATSEVNYKPDVNLDGQFDAQDTLAGRGLKLYCLTSGFSYSCGNLVPNVFKSSGKVTLIGRTSGGGSCVVRHFSTASGSVFQISGRHRISFSKNGGFYDVDRGADPDVYMEDMSKLYDRKYMNTVLDGIH